MQARHTGATTGRFGAALAAGFVALPLGAMSPAVAHAAPHDDAPASAGYQVTPIFTAEGATTGLGKPLTKPDDIVRLGDRLFVAFQNGVGSTGGPANNGGTQSSLVELTPDGQQVGQWDLTGKIDGLGVDPAMNAVVATVDEDGNSSLYTVAPQRGSSAVTHYCYNANPLPHGGGTDSIAYYGGRLVISASAPDPSPADVPAVYAATLEPGVAPTTCPAGSAPATGTAVLTNGFSDTAAATPANAGAPSRLALTDPDSSTVVPGSAPRFGGEFMLDSQGDDQQVYTTDPIGGSSLSVLQLSQSVNDTAFVTSRGALYVTDPSADAVDRVTGPFRVGQAFVAATPCSDNSAPSTCTTANYLGTLDLSSGAVTSVGAALAPQGMLFVPGHQGKSDDHGSDNRGSDSRG
ncbi:MAG TPA: hypothetical protein VFP61_11795 [Acidimicrobiales bacterium]|nr:hypothetical protein [Acidimicrobiales bacterium]